MAPTPAATAAANDDRILIDNSNLTELKLTADEAVERILRRAPSAPSSDGSVKSAAVVAVGSSTQPWKVSHFHTDLRLVLGYTASVLMIAVGVWSYFIEKEWEVNKGPTAIAVVVYLVLSGIQTADAYVQGNRIFYGSRKNANTGKTEQIILSSPPLGRHKLVPASTSSAGSASQAAGSTGKKGSAIPPEYVLEVEYTPAAASGANAVATKKGKAVLGHFAEWVTEEGEFVESIFEERLRSSLAKIVGE